MPTEGPSGLSEEEFQRIQEQLLELRTSNYRLEDENQKQRLEISSLTQKLRNDDPLQFASKLINRSGKKNRDIEQLEDEINNLNRQLATQEEQFRLQQSTMREEFDKVVARSVELEKEMQNQSFQQTINSPLSDDAVSSLEADNLQTKHELDDARTQINELEKQLNADKKEKEAFQTFISDLQAEIETFREAEKEKSSLDAEAENWKEQLYTQKDEHRQAILLLKQEISSLNDKYRKKQESYIQLSEEKEKQYQDYKRSLDEMLRKKDAELSSFLSEMHQLKQQLHVIEQFEEKSKIWTAEKNSLEDTMNGYKADISELRDMNESYQLQLQETHSANDCLSTQLQDAKIEVLNMEKRMQEAEKNAEKRKELLDGMACHVEKVKEELGLKLVEQEESYQRKVCEYEQQIEQSKESAESNEELQSKINEMNNAYELLKKEFIQLSEQFEKEEKNSEDIRKRHEITLLQLKEEHEKQMIDNQSQFAKFKEDWTAKLSESTKDKEICMESIGRLKQEVLDKDEQLKLIEKKHKAFLKEFKRQAASEKKRADSLQERLSELGRNTSPGSSFVRPEESEIAAAIRHQNDAGSVSSWRDVLGNKDRDNDRQSIITGDGLDDSDTCITLLATEHQSLIDRVAGLQKANYELQERVNMLEESNSAMAEDLVNKSAIIGQYVKDKAHILPANPGSPSMEQRLPGSLKKMIEMVKADFSAPDIREMNHRLQIMLEETLTKNMNLEKDLETMAQELQRLSGQIAQHQIDVTESAWG